MERALDHRTRYARTIEPVVRFLQEDETLASRIASRRFLPEGPRFEAPRAARRTLRHARRPRPQRIATRYLDDLADLVRAVISEHFAFTRYAEHLAAAAPSYDPLADALAAPPNLVDQLLLERFDAAMQAHAPDLVGFSAPGQPLRRAPLWAARRRNPSGCHAPSRRRLPYYGAARAERAAPL